MGKRKNKKSQPDQVEKILEDYPDVFADIVNVLIYGGEERVNPAELVDGPTASHFKAAEGNVAQKDRDVIKKNARDGITYAVFGLENQTATNYVMPIRVLGYDYAAYEKMVRDIKANNKAKKHEAPYSEEIWPDQKVLPVVTLVLYFGTEPWKGPTTLYETMDIPEELRPYVSDYKMNLIQVAFLEEDVISKFKSDFQIVAEFFANLKF